MTKYEGGGGVPRDPTTVFCVFYNFRNFYPVIFVIVLFFVIFVIVTLVIVRLSAKKNRNIDASFSS